MQSLSLWPSNGSTDDSGALTVDQTLPSQRKEHGISLPAFELGCVGVTKAHLPNQDLTANALAQFALAASTDCASVFAYAVEWRLYRQAIGVASK